MKKAELEPGYYMACIDGRWQPVMLFNDSDDMACLMMIGDEEVYLQEDFDMIGDKIEVAR